MFYKAIVQLDQKEPSPDGTHKIDKNWKWHRKDLEISDLQLVKEHKSRYLRFSFT
jgi:hypothetical protein